MPLLSYKCNYSNFTKPNGLFHSGPLSPETSSQCWLQERATSQGIWLCFNVTGSCQWYCGLHMKEPQFETLTQLHGVRSSWARLNGSVTLNQTYVTALCGVKELWLVETQWTPTSSFTADGPRGSAVVTLSCLTVKWYISSGSVEKMITFTLYFLSYCSVTYRLPQHSSF